MKVCSLCKQSLPLSDFNNCKQRNDGKQGYCKQCQYSYGKKYSESNLQKLTAKKLSWRKKNPQKDKETCLRWKQNNPASYESSWRKHNKKLREKVLNVVGRGVLKCVRCGCNKKEILEINHINGGGGKEVCRKNQPFYRKIIRGERDIDDLELLCKVCNAVHYVELKHGIRSFQVIWS